jgi:DNA polymerase/3'-5' exonuclease PolX
MEEEAEMTSIFETSKNGDMAAAFHELTELCQQKHSYKAALTYTKVTKAILRVPFQITIESAKSIGRQGDANKVKDIGQLTADKMLEFLQTGNMEMLRTGKIEMLRRNKRQLQNKLGRLIQERNEVALAVGVATMTSTIETKEAWSSVVAKSKNSDMVAALHELAMLHQKEGKYRAASNVRKATNAILRLQFQITTENAKSLGQPGGPNKVKDIGALTADKILEFLQTGTMIILEQKRTQRDLLVNSDRQWVRDGA